MVRYYNEAKSYGFFRRDDTGAEVFYYRSGFIPDLFKDVPRKGDRVAFYVAITERKPPALNIRPVTLRP